jgi:hypothetical protein
MPDNKITASQTEGSNCPENATIIIKMTGVPNEYSSRQVWRRQHTRVTILSSIISVKHELRRMLI